MNCENCKRLESELIQAQATIAEIRDIIQPWFKIRIVRGFKSLTGFKRLKKLLSDVDISALDKHDADALEKYDRDEISIVEGPVP